MSWKIRHEGSPRSIDNLTLPQITQGLADNKWEATDEVMGPGESQWQAIENHPQLADMALDLEPPTPTHHDEETNLDMNPLIDVTLVLLIFFILTTSYETLRKVLELPSAAAAESKGKLKEMPREKVQQLMIKVEARLENGKTVIRIEDQVVEPNDLATALKKFVKASRKTEMLIDATGVDWGTVVNIQDAAKGAGVEKAYYLAQQPPPKP